MQYFIKSKKYTIAPILSASKNFSCVQSINLLSSAFLSSFSSLLLKARQKNKIKLYQFRSPVKPNLFVPLNNLGLNIAPNAVAFRWNFIRYFYLGLGYKVYTRGNTLFIWVGLTHYTLIDFPKSIFIFAKKKRMYILSTQENSFKQLLANIKRAKKKDVYKGKGLLEVKSYKNFIKMKTGKKKQY